MSGQTPSDSLGLAEVRNEFAAVQVCLRRHGRGTRLEISCPQLGTSVVLDATILQALTRLSPESLSQIMPMAMRDSDATVAAFEAAAEWNTSARPGPAAQ